MLGLVRSGVGEEVLVGSGVGEVVFNAQTHVASSNNTTSMSSCHRDVDGEFRKKPIGFSRVRA
jgi:hypothetical protein